MLLHLLGLSEPKLVAWLLMSRFLHHFGHLVRLSNWSGPVPSLSSRHFFIASYQLFLLLLISPSHLIIIELIVILIHPAWNGSIIMSLELLGQHLILVFFHKLVNQRQVHFFVHRTWLLGLLQETWASRLGSRGISYWWLFVEVRLGHWLLIRYNLGLWLNSCPIYRLSFKFLLLFWRLYLSFYLRLSEATWLLVFDSLLSLNVETWGYVVFRLLFLVTLDWLVWFDLSYTSFLKLIEVIKTKDSFNPRISCGLESQSLKLLLFSHLFCILFLLPLLSLNPL